MTLSELLEELRKLDPLAYVNSDPDMLELEDINMADVLQGCLQRACEKRGWTWGIYRQSSTHEKRYCVDISRVAPGYDGDCYNQYHEWCISSVESDSLIEAFLNAYIESVLNQSK
jgi:hypothetical protein